MESTALHPNTAKHFKGAAGSTGLYIGLQGAFLCLLSQYVTNCWEEQRIQPLVSVSLNVGNSGPKE